MAPGAHPIKLDIITPERLAFSDYVDEVYAPGALGPFGVLKGHVTFFSSLTPGILHFTRDGKPTYMAVVRRGFAEVLRDTVTVLADAAEFSTEIDWARAEAAKVRAEKRLERPEGVDIVRATNALNRSLLRLRVAKMA